MAVYRKKLVDKDGNTIIPAVGDIYGTVYTATLSSATAGGRADYEFTPDTPVENNKVYAVKFPTPTVNNATVILGDGVVSGSVLVPPVSATDSPNYELLNTDMINNTEPLLLMYNGVQWVCLNQKKKASSSDIDWTTFKPYWKVVATSSTATVTIPRGFKIYRFTCQGELPASPGTRAVINCQQRASGSNCYVAWHGKCSASSATSGAFVQAWGGEARAIAYLEPVATGVSNTWRATGTIQFENKTGKSYVSVNIDSVAAGSDEANHSKGETDISAGDTFTLVIHRGSGDATSGYWVVEALDEN